MQVDLSVFVIYLLLISGHILIDMCLPRIIFIHALDTIARIGVPGIAGVGQLFFLSLWLFPCRHLLHQPEAPFPHFSNISLGPPVGRSHHGQTAGRRFNYWSGQSSLAWGGIYKHPFFSGGHGGIFPVFPFLGRSFWGWPIYRTNHIYPLAY